MRNFFGGLFILIFLAALGVGSPLEARSKVNHKKAKSAAAGKVPDSSDDLDQADEDVKSEGTSRFKEDSDDTYEDISTEDQSSSKFKEDREEVDQETDSSDQEDS